MAGVRRYVWGCVEPDRGRWGWRPTIIGPAFSPAVSQASSRPCPGPWAAGTVQGAPAGAGTLRTVPGLSVWRCRAVVWAVGPLLYRAMCFGASFIHSSLLTTAQSL